MTPVTRAVFRELLRRELGERYRGALLGGLWHLLLPLLQLAVLAWVFGGLLPARTRTDLPYAAFLAFGLWPWNLFGNGVGRSVTALTDNAALIGKIALPHEVFIAARVAASLAVDVVGFALVLAVLPLFGVRYALAGLPAVLCGLAVIALLAFAIGRWVAVLQVFLRDVSAAIGQLLSLGFFLTPVIYERAQLPPALAQALALNPMAAPVETIRAGLAGHAAPWPALALSAVVAVLAWLASRWLVTRTRAHLEDFL